MNIFKKKQVQNDRRAAIPRSNKSVYSYHSKRSLRNDTPRQALDIKKTNRQKAKRIARNLPALALMVVIMVSGVYVTTLNTNPKIKLEDEAKNTTELRSADEYQAIAKAFTGKSLLNTSKLTFDSDGLEYELKNQFPEIATATVTVPLMSRRPVVDIQVTKPAFILTSGQTSVVAGNNGVALLELSNVNQTAIRDLKTVSDQSGIAIKVGKPALPAEQARFVQTVIEQLEAQGYGVESLSIPRSPYDLHVRLQGKKYFVKFNILDDPLQQSGGFIATVKDLEGRGQQPAEYIDMRVGERVYYK